MSTIYDKIGGDNTLRLVIPIYYYRILSDETLNKKFHKIDMSKLLPK